MEDSYSDARGLTALSLSRRVEVTWSTQRQRNHDKRARVHNERLPCAIIFSNSYNTSRKVSQCEPFPPVTSAPRSTAVPKH